MLKNYLNKDVFRAGIQTYLLDHSYKSTRSDDLWESMTKVNVLSREGELEESWLITLKYLGFFETCVMNKISCP